MDADPLPATLVADRFTDWWRPFAVDLDGERIARRRQGVAALRSELAAGDAVDAVAYAHGDEGAGERIIALVRDAARRADPAFAGAVGDIEPPALVAAALADQLAADPGSDVSTLISLLVLSAGYSRLPPAIDAIRLQDYATRQLEHRAVAVRSAASPPPSTAQELVAEMLDAFASPRDATWEPSPARVRAAQAEILMALAARVDEIGERADAEHAVLREQLAQHTWIMEAWCGTAEAAWQDVAPEARPLLAAFELAERTRGLTPAVGAETLLASVLTASGTGLGVDPDAAVAAAAPYLSGRLAAPPHPGLFPLTTALVRWRSGDPGASSLNGWAPPSWRDELDVAAQAYRELLAMRGVADD